MTPSYKSTLFILIEFILISSICIIPPIFSDQVFSLPPKPVGVYESFYFTTHVLTAAFYEEVLYRLYLPNRLYILISAFIQNLFTEQNNDFRQSKTKVFLGIEAAAICLFAAAHLYLGFFSVLFAGCFGIITRYSYLKLKQHISWALSLSILTIVHTGWNGIVYLYLWHTALP